MTTLATHQTADNSDLFKLEDLFFSRTDKRGVIVTGNEVFVRVSGFERDEIMGAPHKLVRHPETPKGVFSLLWERIKDGKPMGAYIQNKTKNGAPYWVFAIINPTETGYVSVRLKPTSAKLETIKGIYADLLAQEKSGEFTPEESAAELVRRVQDLGFRNYRAFMADALVTEHQDRLSGLDRSSGSNGKLLNSVANRCEEIGGLCDAIFAARDIIAISPVNLSIIAAGFKTDGRPLAVISENFGTVSADLVSKLEQFQAAASQCREAAVDARFFNASGQLQTEMRDIYLAEGAVSESDESAKIIEAESRQMTTRKNESLVRIRRFVGELAKLCDDVRRILSALSVVRVACKIESAALNGGDSGVESMVSELQRFEEEADQHLGKILSQSTSLKDDIASMQRSKVPEAA